MEVVIAACREWEVTPELRYEGIKMSKTIQVIATQWPPINMMRPTILNVV